MTKSSLQQSEWSIWWRWVVATCLGAVAGGLVLLVAFTIVAGTRGRVLGSLDSSLVYGSLLAGLVVAIAARAQQWAFHSYVAFEDYDVVGWWLASGGGTAITMLPLAFIFSGDREWWWLQDLVANTTYWGFAIFFALGLGTSQWVIVRRLGPGTGWWVLWNIAAALLICIIPTITSSLMWGAVIGMMIYAVITASAVLWLHFALGERDAAARTIRRSSTSRLTTVLLIASAAFCLFLIAFVGVSSYLRGDIPNYPRAEQVSTAPTGSDEAVLPPSLTRFTTDDAPIDVLLFYRNQLPNRGWDYSGNVIDPVHGWQSLTFINHGCPFQSVIITATVGLDGRTLGEMDHWGTGCH